MHQRRPLPRAAIFDCLGESRIAGDRVGPIALRQVEVGEACDKLRDAAARSLYLDRDRDGILVVFHQE